MKQRKLLKKLTELKADPDIEIYASDEVIFHLQGSICKMWIPIENKQPRVFLHPTRKSIGYIGAVRLRDGKLISYRPEGNFNKHSYLAFLKHVRMLTSGSKKRIVIVVDNAKYHHAKIVDEWIQSLNGKISLLFLPPYSPELNPIERVWKLVKRTAIHNKYFESLDELASIVEDLFWTWSSGHIVLARLCA